MGHHTSTGRKNQQAHRQSSWWISAFVTSLGVSILVALFYIMVRLVSLRRIIAQGPRMVIQWNNLLDQHIDFKIGDMLFVRRKHGRYTTTTFFDFLVSLPCAPELMDYDVSHVTLVVRTGRSLKDVVVVNLTFSGLKYITLYQFLQIYSENHDIIVGKLNKSVEKDAMDDLLHDMESNKIEYRATAAIIGILMGRGTLKNSTHPWYGIDHSGFTCASVVFMMYERLGVVQPYMSNNKGECPHPNMLLPIDYIKPKYSTNNVIPWQDDYHLNQLVGLTPRATSVLKEMSSNESLA